MLKHLYDRATEQGVDEGLEDIEQLLRDVRRFLILADLLREYGAAESLVSRIDAILEGK